MDMISFEQQVVELESALAFERQQNAELRRERDALAEALEELVACKDLKDQRASWANEETYKWGPQRWDAYAALRIKYERRQPLAWQAARAALAARRQG